MFSMKKKEVIRVKASVKAADGTFVHKGFCIDPEITSFEMLRSLLSKLFRLRSEFTVFCMVTDGSSGGGMTMQALLNDWDLDAALVSSGKPHLRLVLQIKPLDDGLEDWDVVTSLDVTEANTQHHESRTFSTFPFLESIGKALGGLRPKRSLSRLGKSPMCEAEFNNYMDCDGRLVNSSEFRASVYKGGIDPMLRKVAWPHLLNIYPDDMTHKERVEYMKRKTEEYAKLRDEWLEKVKVGNASEEVRFVTSMVKKDVVRTDRTHAFYAGGDDDNCHVVGLFHVLVTYAVHHPDSSYCQGMSDIASPLYVVLRGDEATTYTCFCALMRRLRANFALDGLAMTAKFEHLGLLLQRCDEAFYVYLRDNEADDLFFTYRWLLLELKREFPLDDALLMLEVMWSTLPPDPPITDLDLADPRRNHPTTTVLSPSISHHATTPISAGSLSSSGYSRLRLSRRSSSGKFVCSPPSTLTQLSDLAPFAPPAAIESSGDFSVGNDDDAEDNATECDDSADHACSHLGESLVAEFVRTAAQIEHALSGDEDAPSIGSATADASGKNSGELSLTDDGDCADAKIVLSRQAHVSGSAEGHGDASSLDADGITAGPRAVRDQDVCDRFKPIENECDGKLNTSCGQSVFYVPIPQGSYCQCMSHFYVNLPDSSALDGSCDDAALSADVSPKNVRGLAACSGTLQQPAQRDGEQRGPTTGLDESRQPDVDRAIPPVLDAPRCSHNGERSRQPSGSGVSVDGCSDRMSQSSSDSGIRSHPSTPPYLLARRQSFALENFGEHQLRGLPPPSEFGGGNPFLVCAAATLILLHRDQIMSGHMDFNDIVILFDKMVRKNDVHKVLTKSQALYAEYLKEQDFEDCDGDFSFSFSM